MRRDPSKTESTDEEWQGFSVLEILCAQEIAQQASLTFATELNCFDKWITLIKTLKSEAGKCYTIGLCEWHSFIHELKA